MILDPLLIFVCHLGVIGAALATLLSQLTVCTILYYRMQHCDKILEGSSIPVSYTQLDVYKRQEVSGAKEVPAGHPIDTFRAENVALGQVVAEYYALAKEVKEQHCERPLSELLLSLRSIFNRLMDVDKHYLRKEYLLFPYLEQHGVTGPPVVLSLIHIFACCWGLTLGQ